MNGPRIATRRSRAPGPIIVALIFGALLSCSRRRAEAPTQSGEPRTQAPPDATRGETPTGPTNQPDAAELAQCGNEDWAGSEMCAELYEPVCAAQDTGVRCVRAPCPESTAWTTFSNACFACRDRKTQGYKPGACPDSAGRAWPAP